MNVVCQFDLTYADEKEQKLMADLYYTRLNLVNPLHCDLDFEIDISKCPKEKHADWVTKLLKDVDTWRDLFSIKIPKLKPNQWRSLLFWILSPYR